MNGQPTGRFTEETAGGPRMEGDGCGCGSAAVWLPVPAVFSAVFFLVLSSSTDISVHCRSPLWKWKLCTRQDRVCTLPAENANLASGLPEPGPGGRRSLTPCPYDAYPAPSWGPDDRASLGVRAAQTHGTQGRAHDVLGDLEPTEALRAEAYAATCIREIFT